MDFIDYIKSIASPEDLKEGEVLADNIEDLVKMEREYSLLASDIRKKAGEIMKLVEVGNE